MNTRQSLVPRDHGYALSLLRAFFGQQAAQVYEQHEHSLARVVAQARQSMDRRMSRLAQAVAIAEAAAVEIVGDRDVLSCPAVVKRFLQLRFAGQAFESFVVLFLDAQNRVIAAEELFRGTLTQTSVYPREVVKRALHHNAGAVILSHCHPSGVCEPSCSDELLTSALKAALSVVDVRVLDHIVIAGGADVSFSERGLI